MKAKRWVASFDSATAMMRALGSFLHGRDVPALGRVPTLPLAAQLGDALAELPRNVLEAVYTYTGGLEAVTPAGLAEVRADEISSWITSHYPERRYPAIAIGSSNGALVHLWAALGIPWLPQTLLIPFRQRGVAPDEGRLDLTKAISYGRKLVDRNPDLALHHMHDPNQDRLMIRRMTYFRVKRLVLGAIFEGFIDRCLEPGGTIFVPECTLTWPSVRVDPRYVFQLGAPGGATKDEYVHGGPRVAEFLARQGSPRRRFDFPEPDGESPEAEWGLEPALARDIVRFARERGYRVRRIVHEHPDDPSPLVADLHRWWYSALGDDTSRLLVESFILLEPFACLRTRSVPFWTTFSVESSLAALERYLDTTSAPFDEVNALVFQHGVESVGLATIEGWRRALARGRRDGRFLGLVPRLHPRDFGTFLRSHGALAHLPGRRPLPPPLGLEDLDRFLATRPLDRRVRWIEEDAARRAA